MPSIASCNTIRSSMKLLHNRRLKYKLLTYLFKTIIWSSVKMKKSHNILLIGEIDVKISEICQMPPIFICFYLWSWWTLSLYPYRPYPHHRHSSSSAIHSHTPSLFQYGRNIPQAWKRPSPGDYSTSSWARAWTWSSAAGNRPDWRILWFVRWRRRGWFPDVENKLLEIRDSVIYDTR